MRGRLDPAALAFWPAVQTQIPKVWLARRRPLPPTRSHRSLPPSDHERGGAGPPAGRLTLGTAWSLSVSGHCSARLRVSPHGVVKSRRASKGYVDLAQRSWLETPGRTPARLVLPRRLANRGGGLVGSFSCLLREYSHGRHDARVLFDLRVDFGLPPRAPNRSGHTIHCDSQVQSSLVGWWAVCGGVVAWGRRWRRRRWQWRRRWQRQQQRQQQRQ